MIEERQHVKAKKPRRMKCKNGKKPTGSREENVEDDADELLGETGVFNGGLMEPEKEKVPESMVGEGEEFEVRGGWDMDVGIKGR